MYLYDIQVYIYHVFCYETAYKYISLLNDGHLIIIFDM
jgi:hypothetical protein